MTAPAYDPAPRYSVGSSGDAVTGAAAIAARLRSAPVVVVDTHPGVLDGDVDAIIADAAPAHVIRAATILRSADEIRRLTAGDLTPDLVFGRITRCELGDLVDPQRLAAARRELDEAPRPTWVIGVGAALIVDGDTVDATVVHATMPRWEATLRQRRGEATNLGLDNAGERPAEMYRRGYFIDWRIADRHRRRLWPRIDWLLDTSSARPLMVPAPLIWSALEGMTKRPFRFVPYFDPAPWGGTWMQRTLGVGRDQPNLGWCFDCVPEENSLLLGFGDATYELPGVELVLRQPRELLGETVYGRFGAEFPIRTDLLDTMGGGNLSLQVHPLVDYMRDNFGLAYTQDESYYILAAGDAGAVHLGVRDDVDRLRMRADLEAAADGADLDVLRHINRFPARAHDHFLIPAGTPHGSARDTVVLEISATPYIFTFKLHDWNRPGLDGRPRPLHIDRGLDNLCWDRDESYSQERLINQVVPLASGNGWQEERTGLHEAEFIETTRHWFTEPVTLRGRGRFSVISVVEGDGVIVEAMDGGCDPAHFAYAETFVLPAALGDVVIRPVRAGQRCATIRAQVR